MENLEKRKKMKLALIVLRQVVLGFSEVDRVNIVVDLENNFGCSPDEVFDLLDFISGDDWGELLVQRSAGLSPGCV
jgi:hypothetical protein